MWLATYMGDCAGEVICASEERAKLWVQEQVLKDFDQEITAEKLDLNHQGWEGWNWVEKDGAKFFGTGDDPCEGRVKFFEVLR
jgi:hypothetical protein